MINQKTIGIIGGMGPLATVELFRKLVTLTRARTDREHIHILIDNFPQVPDRTASILSDGESPVPYILGAAERLIQGGAELLLLPCNTSHYYYDEIAAKLSVPVLNMLKLTATYLRSEGVKTVGLLATDGTIGTRVFEKALSEAGIQTLLPNAQDQKTVMDTIYLQVKAGKPTDRQALERVIDALRARGAERTVLGCTELPLVFGQTLPTDLVDPAHLLAIEAIRQAGYEVALAE